MVGISKSEEHAIFVYYYYVVIVQMVTLMVTGHFPRQCPKPKSPNDDDYNNNIFVNIPRTIASVDSLLLNLSDNTHNMFTMVGTYCVDVITLKPVSILEK